MPWLADLVESSDSSLDVLPVQCLCEFLLHESLEGSTEEEDDDDGKTGKNTRKLVSGILNCANHSPILKGLLKHQ